jgi:acyl-CoA synthetase (AMP-forming)/AMP-acid ligase II
MHRLRSRQSHAQLAAGAHADKQTHIPRLEVDEIVLPKPSVPEHYLQDPAEN